MRDDEYAFYHLLVNSAPATDKIFLTSKEDDFIMGLWQNNLPSKENIQIPADILFTGTIPLEDCQISVSYETERKQSEVTFRVHIFRELLDMLKEPDKAIKIGYLMIGKTIIQIIAVNGYDFCVFGRVGFVNEKETIEMIQHCGEQNIKAVCHSCMSTWYGIQIALLHPTIKNVFANPTLIEKKDRSANGNRSNRPVKYIKYHYVKLNQLKNALNEKGIERKCLAWYVIGHWRTYKDGRKVFIKPYWKGALRELKGKALEEPRTREINMATSYNGAS